MGCILLPMGHAQVLLQCPRLQALCITGCCRLETVMVWSEDLTELDLTGGWTHWVSDKHSICRAVLFLHQSGARLGVMINA
jgi:hypothetical protein